jgi:hypothetical protein
VDTPTEKFDIDNAVQADGTSIDLDYIDFVRVQCALFDTAGAFGEISTETGMAFDLSLPNPALLIYGADAGDGTYTYRFVNDSGYNVLVTIGGVTKSGSSIFTLDVPYTYFDYSGGNVTFTKETGLVTFKNG